MNKKNIRILEIAAAGLLLLLLSLTNVLSVLDYPVKDKLYQQPRGVTSRIKIIGIDEHTLDKYGPLQTWSRSIYADLLSYLNQSDETKPAVIGFDIQFSGYAGKGDEELANAIKSGGNVVLVDQLLYEKKAVLDENGMYSYPVDTVEEPYSGFLEGSVTGYSNVSPDSDGTVRRFLPEEKFNGGTIKAFSRVVYEEFAQKEGISPAAIPVDSSGRTMINYSGKPGDYEMIPLCDVLDKKIDARAFKDSIVLVGAYAPGMQDNYKVPSGKSGQMYGVEIHANILQSYMDGRFSVNGNPYVYAAITAIVVMLLVLCFQLLRPWQSILLMVAAIAAQLGINVFLNNKGHAYPVIYLPFITVLVYIFALARSYMEELARKRKVLNAFKKYVAPEVVEQIAKKGDFEIKLGGENRDIAVLFVDIRGFTTMSEAIEPERVVEILNEYLALTTKSIFDNGGTLDKFVGDATMAVFNSPFDLDDYEFRAVCAAMDIVKGGQELEKVLLEKYGRSVGFGVGVHCGRAVVGNVGCDFRMDFTAIGDTVNTSARLEANAKKGQVLISDVLYERLGDRIEVNEIGRIPLKGKSNGVLVYEVTEVHR
ncbi:MAG: adenylate/guanylate cyclase domain-containing protein [Lachnospiraceae bacterium]|nr:adenylate/guanylate cyclase domain-containing protein [Lachnospiraceae bacterium]